MNTSKRILLSGLIGGLVGIAGLFIALPIVGSNAWHCGLRDFLLDPGWELCIWWGVLTFVPGLGVLARHWGITRAMACCVAGGIWSGFFFILPRLCHFGPTQSHQELTGQQAFGICYVIACGLAVLIAREQKHPTVHR